MVLKCNETFVLISVKVVGFKDYIHAHITISVKILGFKDCFVEIDN